MSWRYRGEDFSFSFSRCLQVRVGLGYWCGIKRWRSISLRLCGGAARLHFITPTPFKMLQRITRRFASSGSNVHTVVFMRHGFVSHFFWRGHSTLSTHATATTTPHSSNIASSSAFPPLFCAIPPSTSTSILSLNLSGFPPLYPLLPLRKPPDLLCPPQSIYVESGE